jgi:transcriptional regulator with XRE-family HTH domain
MTKINAGPGYDTARVRAAMHRAIERGGVVRTQLCRQAGISEGSLRKFLEGDKPAQTIYLDAAMRLAHALGISLSEFVGDERWPPAAPEPQAPPAEYVEKLEELRRLLAETRRIEFERSEQLDRQLAEAARLLRRDS